MTNLSLYLHIPFCASKCPYCDFYSLCDFSRQAAYVNRCIEILQGQDAWSTAYIGGGTPSVLAPALLARLLAAIKCEGEFTIECNPTSVTPEFCRTIAEGGINRVSLGVQSAIPEERKALGRSGDIEAVKRAIEMLPIENLSLDVMLGLPGQTIESLSQTLEFCARYAKHISAYLLKLEPGTPFAAHPPENSPDEDAQAALYLHTCEWLEAHGFAQYEISNFAVPGYESRHNLNYWRCGEYYAVGPAAHGFTHGRRWHYERDLDAFLRGDAPIDDGPGGDYEERAMLALRLTEGFTEPTAQMLERAKQMPGLVETAKVAPQGEMSRPKGAVCDRGGAIIKLTREGFLLSNAVIGKLLG